MHPGARTKAPIIIRSIQYKQKLTALLARAPSLNAQQASPAQTVSPGYQLACISTANAADSSIACKQGQRLLVCGLAALLTNQPHAVLARYPNQWDVARRGTNEALVALGDYLARHGWPAEQRRIVTNWSSIANYRPPSDVYAIPTDRLGAAWWEMQEKRWISAVRRGPNGGELTPGHYEDVEVPPHVDWKTVRDRLLTLADSCDRWEGDRRWGPCVRTLKEQDSMGPWAGGRESWRWRASTPRRRPGQCLRLQS